MQTRPTVNTNNTNTNNTTATMSPAQTKKKQPKVEDLKMWESRLGLDNLESALQTTFDDLRAEPLENLTRRMDAIANRLLMDASYAMPPLLSYDDVVRASFDVLFSLLMREKDHVWANHHTFALASRTARHVAELRTAIALAERDKAIVERDQAENSLSPRRRGDLPRFRDDLTYHSESDVGGFLSQLSYGCSRTTTAPSSPSLPPAPGASPPAAIDAPPLDPTRLERLMAITTGQSQKRDASPAGEDRRVKPRVAESCGAEPAGRDKGQAREEEVQEKSAPPPSSTPTRRKRKTPQSSAAKK